MGKGELVLYRWSPPRRFGASSSKIDVIRDSSQHLPDEIRSHLGERMVENFRDRAPDAESPEDQKGGARYGKASLRPIPGQRPTRDPGGKQRYPREHHEKPRQGRHHLNLQRAQLLLIHDVAAFLRDADARLYSTLLEFGLALGHRRRLRQVPRPMPWEKVTFFCMAPG